MLGILGLFLRAAAGHILYLALHLESGSFPRPLSPDQERAAFAQLRGGGADAARLRGLVDALPPRERAVMQMRYGFGGGPRTQQQTAQALGISRSYV